MTETIKNRTEEEIMALIFIPESVATELSQLGGKGNDKQLFLLPFVGFHGKNFEVTFNPLETLPEVEREKYASKSRQDNLEIEGIVHLRFEGNGEKYRVSAPVGKVSEEYKLIA
ncbi:hypothetical protein IQ249_09735 [Lusitaniella coriacea LEGE 07157]|uniref:Uncharacterized protein n=1 Tax=Lusitaniella coriacea LEGE 07157 TaxID=945747 RepID=A0A8J7JAC0_9CYAN|nr:hypothetical protein [Lusitaniella coriacea LEGE 07157]